MVTRGIIQDGQAVITNDPFNPVRWHADSDKSLVEWVSVSQPIPSWCASVNTLLNANYVHTWNGQVVYPVAG